MEPPDPIPNSAVKRSSADDSVRSPHVKVGHRQGFILPRLSLVRRRATGKFILCPPFYLPIFFILTSCIRYKLPDFLCR